MSGPRLSEEDLQALWREYQASKQRRELLQRGRPGAPRESTKTRATTVTAAPETVARNNATSLDELRALGQGATFGFGDELEAGARTLTGGGPYRTVRDDIRTRNERFASEHPGTALGLNLAGGMLTGAGLAKAAAAAPAMIGTGLRAVGLAPKVASTASVAQRIGQAAKMGGAYGAISGAGVAEELGDVPESAVTGAGAGAVLGGSVAGASELMRGLRNYVGGAMQGERPAGFVRRAVRAESPEVTGQRRVLRTIGRAGQTVDEVAAASQTADPETALAELVKHDQGVRGLRIGRNMGRDRAAIDRSLAERAAEEPTNWFKTVARETGVPAPRDPKAVADEARHAIRPRTNRLYGKAAQQPDVADERIASAVETLQAMPEYGPAALRRARTLAAAKGETFPATFRPEGAPTGGTRTARGRLKDFTNASDEALVSEYEAITTRMQRDAAKAQYNVVEADVSGTQYLKKILTATRKGGGPSMQAKAQRRLDQSQQVLERIETELGKRGKYIEDELARRAMNSEAGAQSQSGQLAELFGDTPLPAPTTVNAVRVKDMLRLRRGIDEVMRGMRAEIEAGKGSPELFQSMRSIRRNVDRAAKAAGGPALRKADALTRTARATGESFAAGQRVEQIGTAEGVAQARTAARDPEAFRRGAASKLLERATGVADGEAGHVRNPVQGPLGSATRRMRTRAAFPDDASFARARTEAEKIVQRLGTKQAVSGNSTTAANLSEMADEFGVPVSRLAEAAVNPSRFIPLIVGDFAKATGQGINAMQATEMGRLLGAGLPGQMPRADAVALLKRLEPLLQRQLERELIRRGTIGAGTARLLQSRGR